MSIRFEPLLKKHDRRSFRCGEPVLDRWFAAQASQDEKRDIARVFVAVDDEGIVGFYSLSMFTLTLVDLPAELSRKLPNYHAIPAALIGRLARHERVRGSGLGELLVADAVSRVLAASTVVAAYAIVVEAKNERASMFYESLGFVPFPMRKNRLFLLCDVARRAAARAR